MKSLYLEHETRVGADDFLTFYHAIVQIRVQFGSVSRCTPVSLVRKVHTDSRTTSRPLSLAPEGFTRDFSVYLDV